MAKILNTNKLKELVKKPLFLPFLLFILALSVRFWKISYFPVGITPDHMDYVLNAKSLWLIGSDITRSWNPFSFTSIKTAETALSEMLPVLIAFFIGPFPTNFFIARLPFVLASALLAVFIYLVSEKLLNYKIGLIAAILFMINPWGNHFGRAQFEAPIAVLFFFIAFFIILNFKNWKMIFASLFLILGFYTYNPMKILFLPLSFVMLIIHFLYHRLNKISINYLIFIVVCLVPLVHFLTSFNSQAASTRKEEFFLFSSKLDPNSTINDERRLSIPTPLNTVFSNKLTFYAKYIVSQYVGAYSPFFLYIVGDASGVSAYTTWQHGVFYYLDFFLCIIGFAFLYKYRPKSLVFLCLMLIIGPLPSMTSLGSQYINRSSITIPVLLILIASGMYKTITYLIKYPLLLTLFLMTYTILVVNYYYIYFYRYPIYGNEGYAFDKRILSQYIKRVDSKVNVYVTTNKPRLAFEQYLFYSGLYNSRQAALAVATNMKDQKYQINNVFFIDKCPSDLSTTDKNIHIIETNFTCENSDKVQYLSISNLADTGQLFKIYGDSLCHNQQLPLYSRVKNERDFAVERMTTKEFCTKWINDFSQLNSSGIN